MKVRDRMKILIDNGHGCDTSGKRSPKGKFGILYEYEFNRAIAKPLVERLKKLGIDAELVVPEDNDISLGERCRRVNRICDEVGAKNCIFISIHANASSNCETFQKPSGWSAFVYRKASNASKRLAQCLFDEAEKKGLLGNRAVPDCHYWSAGFYVLKNTKCPAVLTENLFYDNEAEYEVLCSEQGREEIIDLHIKAIVRFIEEIENNK